MLHSDQGMALEAVGNIAGGASHDTVIGLVELGLIQVVLRFLEAESASEEVNTEKALDNALDCLGNLAGEGEEVRGELLMEGVVRVLVDRVLVPFCDNVTLMTGASFLMSNLTLSGLNSGDVRSFLSELSFSLVSPFKSLFSNIETKKTVVGACATCSEDVETSRRDTSASCVVDSGASLAIHPTCFCLLN